MTTRCQSQLGRVGTKILESLRNDIANGTLPSGRFLPPVRELAETHAAGAKTIWRVVKILESEGLVAAQPRQGFRVLAKANDPDRGCPVAFISEHSKSQSREHAFHNPLIHCLRNAATHRGWSLLSLEAEEFTAGQLVDRLRCTRAFGAIIDSTRPEVIQAVKAAGIPCLMLDAWRDDAEIDAVLQNGQMGSILAARYLLDKKCHRIAWVGLPADFFHTFDRLGGALSVFASVHPRIEPELLFAEENDGLEKKIVLMLKRPNRPDGIIALWQSHAIAVKKAADQLGLVVGKDLELVGWCPAEMYENFYRPEFGVGPIPPTVTWSIQTLAETAMSRLAERRETPSLPPLWMKIPVTLKVHTEGLEPETKTVVTTLTPAEFSSGACSLKKES